jgi:hypothetical protein
MLTPVPPDERPSVWTEIEDALRRFESPAGFVGPCEMLVAGATR